MIIKNVFDKAKGYLCWDVFKNMTIQLIDQQENTAYFFPPNTSQSTIIVFYHKESGDFTTPLFLMFHEAGHCIQHQTWIERNKMFSYTDLMNTPTGTERCSFEMEAWDEGRKLLKSFLLKQQIPLSLLNKYDQFSEENLKTYQ